MARSRLTAEIERDRRNIARLYLQGITQADIAAELGVSQPTVSRDLKVIQEQWKVDRVNDLDERKNIELAKIDYLELEYWEAWKRSQLDAEVQTIEQQGVVKDADGKVVGNRIKKTDRKEGQSGNPAFLRGVEWCINKRCEILGLDAPKKTDLTTGGEPLPPPQIIEIIRTVEKDKGDE